MLKMEIFRPFCFYVLYFFCLNFEHEAKHKQNTSNLNNHFFFKRKSPHRGVLLRAAKQDDYFVYRVE